MLTILTYCSIGIAATAAKGMVRLYTHTHTHSEGAVCAKYVVRAFTREKKGIISKHI